MGHRTIGIFYGVVPPEGVPLTYEDLPDEQQDEGTGILDDWDIACSAKIDALAMKLGGMWRRGDASRRYVPDHETEGDLWLLGFWVAVRNHGRDEAQDMTTVPLADLRKTEPYAKGYKNARRRWRRFAKWATARGVPLDKPRLYVAETEVA